MHTLWKHRALPSWAHCALTKNVLVIAALAGFVSFSQSSVSGADSSPPADNTPTASVAPPAPPQPLQRYYIREYRVTGAHQLSKVEICETVYPFLGPGRTADDIEQARAALEKAFQGKGYQTVSVSVPEQRMTRGIVVLQVTEAKVGRLRVKGSRFFSLEDIKKKVPSLAEGKVPNFNEVTQDIIALNQLPDRRVTPTLRQGAEPGTVDIDLNVQDTFPLHGSLELNNRYSANTSPYRVNGSLSYNDLWQMGHSVGASFQISPQNRDEVEVFSGFYTLRFPAAEWLSVTLQGTKQNSNVSTLGSVDVAGRGEVFGLRIAATLPGERGFFQSVTFGIDYKHFDQEVMLGVGAAGTSTVTPITYYPISLAYNATWSGTTGSLTEFNASVTFHPRGLGSSPVEFDANRYNADGAFIYVRGDLARTQPLPFGFQGFGKVQGQIADSPLVNSEQFGGGGLSTVRGYLEAEELGDNAVFGTLELRSPSLLGFYDKLGEWRVYVFGDAGMLSINDPLPDQTTHFTLASFGIGSRIRLLNHLNGSIDAAIPLITQAQTISHHPFLTFRVWADF